MSYVVARLERAVRRGIEEQLRPFGLTVPEFTTLSVLLRRTGMSNAQLARRSYITPQSMNVVVLELERKGLVERRTDPAHGRIRLASVTAKGRRLAIECEAAVAVIEEQMLADLNPSARERLLHELGTCVHALGAGLPDL
jgi:DNA-binding MarR family transcriptional regulator